jgi:hypothetical protein
MDLSRQDAKKSLCRDTEAQSSREIAFNFPLLTFNPLDLRSWDCFQAGGHRDPPLQLRIIA